MASRDGVVLFPGVGSQLREVNHWSYRSGVDALRQPLLPPYQLISSLPPYQLKNSRHKSPKPSTVQTGCSFAFYCDLEHRVAALFLCLSVLVLLVRSLPGAGSQGTLPVTSNSSPRHRGVCPGNNGAGLSTPAARRKNSSLFHSHALYQPHGYPDQHLCHLISLRLWEGIKLEFNPESVSSVASSSTVQQLLQQSSNSVPNRHKMRFSVTAVVASAIVLAAASPVPQVCTPPLSRTWI